MSSFVPSVPELVNLEHFVLPSVRFESGAQTSVRRYLFSSRERCIAWVSTIRRESTREGRGKDVLEFLAMKMKARTVVGRREKSSLSDRVFELHRREVEGERYKCQDNK